MPSAKKRLHTIKTKKLPERSQSLSLEFSAKEFPTYEKNSLWYFGLAILAIGLLFLTFQYRNYLVSAVIVATVLAIISLAKVNPRAKSVKIDERGVTWGNDFFAYHQLKAFWIAHNGDNTAIYLERPSYTPDIHLTVPENQASIAVEILSTFLPFHHHRDEPIGDKFNRLLKI